MSEDLKKIRQACHYCSATAAVVLIVLKPTLGWDWFDVLAPSVCVSGAAELTALLRIVKAPEKGSWGAMFLAHLIVILALACPVWEIAQKNKRPLIPPNPGVQVLRDEAGVERLVTAKSFFVDKQKGTLFLISMDGKVKLELTPEIEDDFEPALKEQVAKLRGGD